jgi:hypothetical protein
MPVKRWVIAMGGSQNLVAWTNPIQFNTIYDNEFSVNLTQWNWYQIIIPETWLYTIDVNATSSWTTLSPSWYIWVTLYLNNVVLRHLSRYANYSSSTDPTWRIVVSSNSIQEKFTAGDLIHCSFSIFTWTGTYWTIYPTVAYTKLGITKIA